jgi:mRNA-degrading endonuclease RelE of RelBE toxin-antitoxin system
MKLRGADDVWGARLGEYRILYRIEDDRLVVLVIRIGQGRRSVAVGSAAHRGHEP